MTETNMPLMKLLQKHDEGDFLRAVMEAVLQTLMEHDVEGLFGAGRYERGAGRQTYRNGYRDREQNARMGASIFTYCWAIRNKIVSAHACWTTVARMGVPGAANRTTHFFA